MASYTVTSNWQPLNEGAGILQNLTKCNIYYTSGTDEPAATVQGLKISPAEVFGFNADAAGVVGYIRGASGGTVNVIDNDGCSCWLIQ